MGFLMAVLLFVVAAVLIIPAFGILIGIVKLIGWFASGRDI